MACPKGWESLSVLQSPDRAVAPLLRTVNGKMEQVDWDIALQTFVDRMKTIQNTHGPHSIAFLSTGQIVTEEMALFGALAKFGMGMLHGDGNTRQCMATAVTAYKESFGFDAPPYTYADFEQSDVIVLIGSNLCIAHPILWQRVMRESPSAGNHRNRSAGDGNIDGGNAAFGAVPEVGFHAAVRRGAAADRTRLDRPRSSLPRTPAASRPLPSLSSRIRWNESPPKHDLSPEAIRTIRPIDPSRASEFHSGGRWASTKAIKACARHRRLSIWL